ncbi:flavin monoamine oxidase family protein [Solitalea canadensis]|uniref:Monoamine oxidase n=1 Tax=Solitalea canadensis (strain ATCC 29591 / DSM 3403 / JCM 21819 / LMG 8368 / NBRC 15130 / NCIMB 12057 / USAM 9D) TaxID=929556 RepID=H8KXC4_SOLCM|nr:FAD-dependent oxidoreductase [Solitalea canadensis]AFD08453.1 monoamine oxidase [Solitalea canadensis DSM 3403]
MNRHDFIVRTGITTAGLLVAPSKGFKEVVRRPDKVIIIGGGLAGLTAAYELRKAGVDLLLLEGSDRLGGRIVTTCNQWGITEMGAEWIGFSHSSVRKLCDELQLQLAHYRFSLHRLQNGVYCKPGRYPINNDDGINSLPALRSSSVFSNPNNEMDFKIDGGNYRIIESIAGKLSSAQIKTGRKVAKVIDTGKEFIIGCVDGKVYKSSTVICALPAPFIKSIRWEPDLPSDTVHSIAQADYQTCLKIVVNFDKRLWDNSDFQMISDLDLPYVYDGGQGDDKCLTFAAAGDKAKHLLRMNHWERKEAIVSTLMPALGNVTRHISSINYYAGLDASKMISYGALDMDNIIDLEWHDRLHFCGDYLTSYRGFMEASVRSAKTIVGKLLS